MTVIKLDSSHCDAVRGLFHSDTYMGTAVTDFAVGPGATATGINRKLYNVFCSNYLSGINSNFHAFGWLEDGEIKALISFYESIEEPAWYYTLYRSGGDAKPLVAVLDAVIEYNEANNRLKFYTLVNARHSRALRRFHWSPHNNERYGYFDEYQVPAKNKCYYVNAWELLYKRFLSPVDTIVRCNFLKQEYRDTLPIGGNI